MHAAALYSFSLTLIERLRAMVPKDEGCFVAAGPARHHKRGPLTQRSAASSMCDWPLACASASCHVARVRSEHKAVCKLQSPQQLDSDRFLGSLASTSVIRMDLMAEGTLASGWLRCYS